MKTLQVLSLVILSLLFLSSNSYAQRFSKAESRLHQSKSEVNFSSKKLENPYNYVGEQHNKILKRLSEKYDNEIELLKEPIEKELFIAKLVFKMESVDYRLFIKAKKLLEIERNSTLSEYNFLQYNKLFKKLNLSVNAIDLLSPKMKKLIEIDGTTSIGIKRIETLIHELEMEFSKRKDARDFETVMSYLATLKYSARYWHSNEDKFVSRRNKPKWWQVVLADAAGAGVGVLVGGGTAVPMAAGFSKAVASIK